MGIRVLCIEDDSRLRTALERMLSKETGLEVVPGLASADEMVQVALREQIHVVVTDLSMPGTPPLDAVRELKRARPDARVIVLTGWSSPVEVTEARRAGASAVLQKTCDPVELIAEVKRGAIANHDGHR